MTDPLVMAIDAGTGSCRAIVFDLQGREKGSAQREWTHHAVPDVPGGIDFDTDANGPMIDEVICSAIERAGAPPDAIKAVSTTSMREGIVLYDKSGRELWGCPNIDSRASEEAESLVKGGQAARIFEIAGDWVSITAPARLLWLKHHRPEIIRDARSMNLISDWIATRLTGEFTTEPSAGSSTAMFDLKTRDWSAEVFEMCGIDPDICPRVVESGAPVGTVQAEATRRCGLVEGTPVVAGGADTQLALLGLNRQPGEATLVGGSFWQMTTVLDEPVIDSARGPRTLCHAVPGQWMIEGIGFLTGLALRWFRDGFWSGNENASEQFQEMERRAAEVPPGSNGVVAVMANVMQSDSWVHASPTLLGFDFTAPENSGRDQATRAIMEAGAYAAAYHRDYLQDLLGQRFETITFTGGSAHGSIWPQIIADVMGVQVSIPQVKETTALGAAILAATGAQLFPNTQEASKSMASPEERVVTPNVEAMETYASRRHEWKRINDAMVLLAEQGVTRPMWRAAGAIPRTKGENHAEQME